jgi:signal transduction histidine kinase
MTEGRAESAYAADSAVRRALLAAPRGLSLSVLSILGGPIVLVAVLALALTPAGIGLVAAPAALLAAREIADLFRAHAHDWSGVVIQRPYRPRPASGPLRTLRWLLTDPATWRDLLWLLVNAPFGFLVGLLPVALLVYGFEGVVTTPFTIPLAGDQYNYGLCWFIRGTQWYLVPLAVGQGALLLALALTGPRLLRWYARVSRGLLGPTRKAELALRVERLTETRTQAVDASAAELRRIERDLHDGAQARLVSMAMTLGMAEDLFRDEPDKAFALLMEARQASGDALRELRDLVRGIHPPVLAERGLDGAVRALALTLPLPVAVVGDLPARPSAPIETAGYFAVVEALANAAKHARATRAEVRMHHADGRLTLTVTDDGAGGADPALGSGLRGIERRLSAFDGRLTVTSPPGGPTVLAMTLPCALNENT